MLVSRVDSLIRHNHVVQRHLVATVRKAALLVNTIDSKENGHSDALDFDGDQ